MFKKLLNIRFVLFACLVLSIGVAGYGAYYKVKYWGFSLKPNQTSDVWTIEAHIAFDPTNEPIKVSMATPSKSNEFKILGEDIIAPKYKKTRVSNGVDRVVLTSRPKTAHQNIYYRVMLYDNMDSKGREKDIEPNAPQAPAFDQAAQLSADEILKLAARQEGDEVQQIIHLLNQNPLDDTVMTFLPVKKTEQDMLDAIKSLLSYKKIPNRTVRGIKLEEERVASTPDLMLEAYMGDKWKIYDIKTGEKGVPKNFVVFKRGGESLVDIEGGENSSIKFSVLKSVTPSFVLASHRAKLASDNSWFKYSIYSLPLLEQNILKWLMIFPLGILVVVVLRNVVGLQTMGTFTPMLLAFALIKAGFWAGLMTFGVIVTIGLFIRYLLSHCNLLLVPRIASVVICVILIMQMMTICGYQFDLNMAQSAAFFPIIIMAWIIERASITWEEDGAYNAIREIIFSVITAIVIYFIVSFEYIRHIMFAFNEINLVILFAVMLLGTYTGYRLTELRRFTPLAKKRKRRK